MKANELEIQVRDTVFNPALPQSDPRNKVHYQKRAKDTYYYRVFLFIDGYDLPYVESVTYTFDDSFPEPTQTVRRTPQNTNCQIAIWTWQRQFTLSATIVDKKGNTYQVMHEMTYAKELKGVPHKRYKQVEADLNAVARPTLVR